MQQNIQQYYISNIHIFNSLIENFIYIHNHKNQSKTLSFEICYSTSKINSRQFKIKINIP